MASLPSKVDRQTTTPFLLKLFYKEGSFTPLSDFHLSSYSSSTPPHITLYTWQTCTLRELAHLIAHSHPQLLPTPSIGTRLAFRLIFPDTRSAGAGGASSLSSNNNAPLGRFLHQDLGSVVLGDDGAGVGTVDAVSGEDGKAAAGVGGLRSGAGGVEQADVMLKDVRFVIGDYIAVAILPPLGNGNVAPMLGPAGQNAGMGGVARGGRAAEVGRDHYHQEQGFGRADLKRGGGRENGFGGFRGRGGRGAWGGGPGVGGPRGVALPSGEWRRGERLPDGPPGGGGRGGFGGGRGRDRW